MTWPEVVEVVRGVVVEGDRAGWAVHKQVGPEEIAFAPVAGTVSRTQWECPATRRSAPNVAL